jgi:hypothetical protein
VDELAGAAIFAGALHVKAAVELFFLLLFVVGLHWVWFFLLTFFTLFLIFYILFICIYIL